jgi:alkanesulfonate monooxygenase SsuD/methylene tetrahydromethanopterin reductase-like flavin-dependent oxidoreductase (luciferase family)
LLTALAGKELRGGDRLYPAHPSLLERLWYATFSAEGGRLAGELGAGLMLSRTQPRPKDRPGLSLAEIQEPVIEAYVKALPSGVAPRIMASRSVFVTDRRETAWDHAAVGLSRYHARLARLGRMPAGEVPPVEALVRRQDVHLGTAEEVIASLRADAVLRHATELAVQVHSIDPPHELVLRSIEKVAREVAPVLGFGRNA